jgi:hypothetical protein
VFPLVLHHITGGSAAASRDNIVACLREAKRVLRAGGTFWAVEIFVSNSVYGIERALAPLTRRLLAARNIPLVIFHSQKFYEAGLETLGFSNVSVTHSNGQRRWYELERPVVGLGLRVPRIMVPVRYGLIRATA